MDDIYCSALEVHPKIVTLKCLCTVCKGVYTHIHINIFLSDFIHLVIKSRHTFVNQKSAQNFIVSTQCFLSLL